MYFGFAIYQHFASKFEVWSSELCSPTTLPLSSLLHVAGRNEVVPKIGFLH